MSQVLCNRSTRVAIVVTMLVVTLGAACSDDSADEGGSKSSGATTAIEAVDYEALGLWDDGPCDEALPPLKVGLMTVFESPVLSLGDYGLALEAAADGFNARGGANGSCIQVHLCDDGGNADQAMDCVREIDKAGVVATINDQTTAGSAEVAEAMAAAGIPRIATSVTPDDWDDPNAYPLDASGTGNAFLVPQTLVADGAKTIGVIRPGTAQAAALVGLLGDLYDEDGVTFPFDTGVPAGTTDFSQFILGAENARVDGISVSLGEQEAVQVVRAAAQLGSKLSVGAALGSFSHQAIADFGDFAEQMTFLASIPPITADIPVFDVIRDDLAARGEDVLQPANMKTSPIRSWIGLYALLKMLRDGGGTDFTRESITATLQTATDVPMLGIFGDENWTPNRDRAGLFKRAGTDRWMVYRWDPDADAPGDLKGNFVEMTPVSFDAVMCGSPFGSPEPC